MDDYWWADNESENGKYGVYNSAGKLILMCSSADAARVIAEEYAALVADELLRIAAFDLHENEREHD